MVSGGLRSPIAAIRAKMPTKRACSSVMKVTSRSRSGRERSILATSSRNADGSNSASRTASKSSSLDANARKIVPSAMPAASAISRVVVAWPCS